MQANLFLTSLFALFGIIIGASLQFIFNRHVSREGKYLDQRFVAYLDFMKSLCSNDIDARLGAELQLVAYAHDRVLQPFLEFQKLGGYIGTEQQMKAFVRVVRAIRKDAGSKANYTDEDLFFLAMSTEWDKWKKPSRSANETGRCLQND
jgi:hypothetical protein